MSEVTQRKVSVFFSWQSDSPAETNSKAIRTALKKAANGVKKKHAEHEILSARLIITLIQDTLEGPKMTPCTSNPDTTVVISMDTSPTVSV